MTLNQNNEHNLLLELMEVLNSSDSDGMRSLLEAVLNAVMKTEREVALGAGSYQRSDERKGYANGYKPKKLKGRLGELELQVPQTRGVDFYPSCLERGLRSEKALKLAIAEMYLKGVSTRKVAAITEELCGLDVNSSQVSRMTQELDAEFEPFRNRELGCFPYVYLDALYLKVRHQGVVIDQAVLVAYGINSFGKREVIGTSISLSEAEVHWRSFMESLQKRGLNGVRLLVSDDHSGLRAALRSSFPSVPWQRCQFHMMQNAQHYTPRKTLRADIVSGMREIFNSGSLSQARTAVKEVCQRFSDSAPEFVHWLEGNIEEGLTCYRFPREHRRRIRTTNGLERVNREIKRRTKVATLFPNSDSALRLVTGVLIEIHEDWITGKAHMDMSHLGTDEEAGCERVGWALEA